MAFNIFTHNQRKISQMALNIFTFDKIILDLLFITLRDPAGSFKAFGRRNEAVNRGVLGL